MKKKTIIALSVSALTGISLLLALVLSPLRGYYTYTTTLLNKTKVISGVDFSGKIKNARSTSSYQVLSDNSLNIPGNATNAKTRSINNGYGETSVNSDNASGLYFINNATINGVKAFDGESNLSGNKKGNNVSGNAVGFISSASLSKQANLALSSKPGFRSTTTDLTLAQKAGTKLNVGSPPPEKGNPPAPTPNLPVGNGIQFMLILAVVFGSWKIKKSFN